jgi:predicted NBD/HSP70 family sugar kinase
LIRLNPDGAYAVGVKIGRRSLDILLMDLVGGISCRARHLYRYPTPAFVRREIERGIDFVCAHLPGSKRERLVGVGICAPSQLDRWAEELAAPVERLAEWRDIDIEAEIAAITDLPVAVMNDVAAATSAEITLGSSITAKSCLYIYIGAFVGGGIVLSGQLVGRSRDTACAIGSLPLTGLADVVAGRPPEQLIRRASLIFLERELEAAGFDLAVLDGSRPAPAQAADIYRAWRQLAVAALAYAISSAISVFDFAQVVIDGSLPPSAVSVIVGEVNEALDRFNLTGLRRPEITCGGLGDDARVLGAGLIPINAKFGPDRNLLLKLALDAE